ncbi:MAG TPA: hypothetical protein VMX55_03480 [candidate division Zixibacteria bacterium]|nr:hypothetical protein [candidate division Zixibacteria bacterium]
MKLLVDTYLSIFEDEKKEVKNVIDIARNASPDFKLTEKTRTLIELVNHIAQIPRIDIGIYSGELDSGEKAHAMEVELTREKFDDILKIFDDGCNYLQKYFSNMTDEDFLEENLKAFYELDREAQAWTHYFAKLITHMVLHKGILWAYLKAANLNVNMFTYYGAKLED